MTEPPKPLTLAERIAAAREKHNIPVEQVETKPHLIPVSGANADLIPQVYELTDSDRLIDETISRIDIRDAYKLWIGKEMDSHAYSKTESIMISCPFPDHVDSRPSAWMNSDIKQFNCGPCGDKGGDIFTLASIGFGYGEKPPGGAEFHRLKEKMAEAFGTHIKKGLGGEISAWRDDNLIPTPEPASPPVALASFEAQTTQATQQPYIAPVPEPVASNVLDLPVVPIDYDDTDDPDELVEYPTLNWRSIIPEDTFLWEYMSAACIDDSPEEYHFWHGMIALAHTVGRRVQLLDNPPVNANLLICLLGGTGFGKSKSRGYLTSLLEQVLPFKDNGATTSGVKELGAVGSGEVLIRAFQHETKDPTTLKPTGYYTSVNGVAEFDELARLLAISNRQGSTLKSIVMEFADAKSSVRNMSLSSGVLVAKDPFCSFITTTQPKSIRTLVTKSDESSGFLNRWIFAGGKPKPKVVFGGTAHGGVEVDMSRAKDQLKLVKGWGASERKLTIDPDAIAEIVAFFNSDIYPLQRKTDSDLLKRMDVMYKKLLLIFTINNKESVVTVDTHRRIKEIIPYLLNCYALISAEIGITQSHEMVAEIMRHIERHTKNYGKGPTPRELQRYMHRKNYPIEQVKRNLETMMALEYIEKMPMAPGPGRKSDRYIKVTA